MTLPHLPMGAVLGYGTWPLGGRSYGRVDAKVAKESLCRAADSGISMFDTANIYGDGSVETLLGRVFGRTSDIRIVTKVGYLNESDSLQDFSEDAVLRSVRASIGRLKRGRLDAVLFHSPPREILCSNEFKDVILRLSESHLAAELGVSLRNVHDMDIALELPRVSQIEVILNLLDQRVIDLGLLDRAAEIGVQVIARIPLCFGFLAGKYHVGKIFPGEDDHRARWPRAQLDAWSEGANRFQFLCHESRSLVQSALAFCLSTAGVTYVIPGMKSHEQVTHNLGAMRMNRALSTTEYDRVRHTWKTLRSLPPQ